jgi:two-component system CheB/CheR fusion protein
VKKNGGRRAHTPSAADDGRNEHAPTPSGVPFPIVGIGASAGGLEAFRELLRDLPPDTGMGFVLVQHLDPEHDSVLPDLLQRVTSLPVHEVTNNLQVEPNHVYVIPPNTNLGITAGALTLRPRPRTRTPARSIDAFLEALAGDQREWAIGVILSGTATDGTMGLEAIKAEGGITFAQDASAKYDSMPRSAVAAGCVDFVLSPTRIAKELARIAKHPAVVQAPPTGARQARAEAAGGRTAEAGLEVANGFKKVLLLLRNHAGVDFSLYKSSTIQRRITRRMVLSKEHTPEDYARFLHGNTKELDALYSDVLISVTSFFRNPDSFDVLQHRIFPEILKQRTDDPLRVWVLGCSTGQEAYSIVMAFTEAADKASRPRTLQVFATDLNDGLLNKARHGLYAKSIAQDLSPERLRRFFVEEEGGFRISKSLREQVVFARQNVISDPPFSRMDLISCRNLLIYFEADLQRRLFPVFHYALKPGGFLYLGASESIGGFTELFEPVDKSHKIYGKKAAPTPTLQLPARQQRGESSPSRMSSNPLQARAAPGGPVDGLHAELSAQREADRIAINQFAPPAVVINADLQVLQFRGPTGAYLEPPTGKASFDVLKMARSGLMLPLRAAINKAKKGNKTARKEGVRIEQDGSTRTIDVEVIPLKNLRDRCFMIVFHDLDTAGTAPVAATGPRAARRTAGMRAALTDRASRAVQSGRIAELETELAETRDYLQSIRDQHEAANEELQASNEEVQSANEELQSMNEELETSKEELESANEELTTVNEEMANRNAELNRLNSDLINIQTSAHQAIVLLGRDLTIRRFSAQAERYFSLLAADVGRPFASVRHTLDVPDLERFITSVVDTVRAEEREVRDKDGRWFSLRLRPYITLDNRVEGAVLVLVDIDRLKQSERDIAGAREYAENVIDTVREPLLVLDADLRVERVNHAFYRTFRVTQEETIGKRIYELGNHQWDVPALRTLLDELLIRNNAIEALSITHDFEQLGTRTMLLNATRMHNPANRVDRIVVAIEDVTERTRAEDAVRRSRDDLQSHADELTRFNRVAVDRELRMIELKREINGLRRRLGDPPPYPLEFEPPQDTDG